MEVECYQIKKIVNRRFKEMLLQPPLPLDGTVQKTGTRCGVDRNRLWINRV